jgi:spore germination cell wall hydrolase CwlJ-like protein
VLTRDIYRDFYKDSGPTIGERLFVASKRLCFVFAGAALSLGALDVMGVHSIVGATAALHDAPAKLAGFGETLRNGINSISFKAPSMESIRVAIPQQTVIRFSTKKEPTVIDDLVAVRAQDAVSLAMTSAQPTFAVASLPSASIGAVKTEVPSTVKAGVLGAVKSQATAAGKAEAPVKLASLPLPSDPVAAMAVPASLSLAKEAAAPVSTPDLTGSIILPTKNVPMPPAAPPVSPADRLGLKGAEYAKAERCLANAIYFEARSEPVRGQMAVAQVVLNRVFSGVYPDDVCSVVYQNAHRRLACQFTFACDGKSKAITDRGSWARSMRIARQTLDGQLYLPEVGKSTHYHATYVSPTWARTMHRLVRHGVHNFYRPYAWGRGDEKPIWGTAAMAAEVRAKSAGHVVTR